MPDSVPEYYRHLAEQDNKKGETKGESEPMIEGTSQNQGASTRATAEDSGAVPKHYRADAFRMDLPSADWSDKSVYTITGPTLDGVTHNISITTDAGVEAESVYDFAGEEIAALKTQLEECRILLDDPIELYCGKPAYRVIFFWYPEDDLKLYQEQLYVLDHSTGYTLTASFTRNTRKQIGDDVERMMLSFQPTASLGQVDQI